MGGGEKEARFRQRDAQGEKEGRGEGQGEGERQILRAEMGDDRLRAEGEREEREKKQLSGADGKKELDDESWATSGYSCMRCCGGALGVWDDRKKKNRKKNMQVRMT